LSDKVMIPLSLLDRLIELFGYLDVSNYDYVIKSEFRDVLWHLTHKRRRIDLRNDYAKIICADNEDDRDDARIRYLQSKRWIDD